MPAMDKVQSMQDTPMDKTNYIRERIEAAKQRKADAAELAEFWSLNFAQCPVERQFTIWLRRYATDAIIYSIECTAEWYDNEAQKAETAGTTFSKQMSELTAYATGIMIKKTAGDGALNGRKYTRVKPTTEKPEVGLLDESLRDDDGEDLV